MKKLWQKDWTLNSLVEEFETRSDLDFDKYLLPFDLVASCAHAQMLTKIGLLTAAELTEIEAGLAEIAELDKQGEFTLTFGEEDIHTKIENFLTEHYGEAGKKIHTGRSRNDQVLTAVRLFSKQELLAISEELLETAAAFTQFAQAHELEPMPGYTHMQKAMPSSLGMWAGAFAEGCMDDLMAVQSAYELIDQSPLGSGAGYGVPLPLDRQLTADLLGFKKVQNNSLYCQNSRGKIESVILAALNAILAEVNKFATDVLLFTTEEFGLLKVGDMVCSGSSIMPQKKNLDLAELLRSKIHVVMGNYIQTISIVSNLPSGYNRDFQDTKKPLIESLLLTKQCLQLTQLLITQLSPCQEKIAQQMTPNLFATHHAYQKLAEGTPFRDAYLQAAEALKAGEVEIPKDYLKLSRHLGGTGNLQLSELMKSIIEFEKVQKNQQGTFKKCLNNLLAGVIDYS